MTPKQEQFARLYVETGNASEAYRRAYDAEKMKPETVTNEAYKLLQDPDITAMIDGLKAEHKARHYVTVDSVLDELEQARQRALSAPTPQSSAAVSATMGKAKILGLIVDKTELKAEVNETTPKETYELTKFTNEEIQGFLKLYREKKLETTIADILSVIGAQEEYEGEEYNKRMHDGFLMVYTQSLL